MTTALVMSAVFVASMVLVGRIAAARGYPVKSWKWMAAMVGPLAIVMLALLPRRNGTPHSH